MKELKWQPHLENLEVEICVRAWRSNLINKEQYYLIEGTTNSSISSKVLNGGYIQCRTSEFGDSLGEEYRYSYDFPITIKHSREKVFLFSNIAKYYDSHYIRFYPVFDYVSTGVYKCQFKLNQLVVDKSQSYGNSRYRYSYVYARLKKDELISEKIGLSPG